MMIHSSLDAALLSVSMNVAFVPVLCNIMNVGSVLCAIAACANVRQLLASFG